MEQMGFVKKISNGKAEIEVKRISACGENCKSCGGGCDGPKHMVILPNNIGAKVGDYVEIKGETKKYIKIYHDSLYDSFYDVNIRYSNWHESLKTF